MNAVPSNTCAMRTMGSPDGTSIGASMSFWAALRALPVDFEDDSINEIARAIVEAVDAHTSSLQDRLSAQTQEIAGMRARQVALLCQPSPTEEAQPAAPPPAEKASTPVEQADVDALAECAELASGLTVNAGSPANTIAARKLFARLETMRDDADEAMRTKDADPIPQLAMSFAKRHQSYDSFQNHSHRYLAKRLGAGEANDVIGCSLRLVRAAAIVAREFTVSGASLRDIVSSINDVKPMPSKADAVGEVLIALAGVASAGRLHLDSIGDERLAALSAVRTMPSFYSANDSFPIPF